MTGPAYSLRKPPDHAVAAFRLRQARLGFSYPYTGCIARGMCPPGYAEGRASVVVGEGPRVFAAAKYALQEWRQFPAWVTLDPPAAPVRAGTAVAVLARVHGVWVWNACRVLSVEDSPHRFALTYGTLPAHAMLGEERFAVELRPDGTVSYEVFAVSRPATRVAAAALPLIRAWQRRFRADSCAAVLAATSATIGTTPRPVKGTAIHDA